MFTLSQFPEDQAQKLYCPAGLFVIDEFALTEYFNSNLIYKLQSAM